MSRRWRRLSRITNFAVCVPARCRALRVREQRHVAGAELRRARRSPTPAASSARSAPAAGPRTRTAKSTRGGLCPGVFMSSMMLMPPTNATRAVDVAELAVQAAQPMRAELPRRDLGPVLEQLDAAVASAPLEAPASDSGARPSRRPARAPTRRAAPPRSARRRPRARRRRRRRCRSRARPRARRARSPRSARESIRAPLRSSVDRVARREAVHRARLQSALSGRRAAARRARTWPRAPHGRTCAPAGTRSGRARRRREPARVDPVEAEHRHHRRKRSRGPPAAPPRTPRRRRASSVSARSALRRQSLKSPAMISGASRGTVARIRSTSAWICHCRPRSNRPRWTLRQCRLGSVRAELDLAMEQAAAFEQRAPRCPGSPARAIGKRDSSALP